MLTSEDAHQSVCYTLLPGNTVESWLEDRVLSEVLNSDD